MPARAHLHAMSYYCCFRDIPMAATRLLHFHATCVIRHFSSGLPLVVSLRYCRHVIHATSYITPSHHHAYVITPFVAITPSPPSDAVSP